MIKSANKEQFQKYIGNRQEEVQNIKGQIIESEKESEYQNKLQINKKTQKSEENTQKYKVKKITQSNVEDIEQNFNYVFHVGDKIINHKKQISYLARQLLGKGSFGQVILCESSQGYKMAMKVLKKKPAYINQGLLEVKMLRQISKIEKATHGFKENYLNLYDAFMWQGYLCIAMQVMDNSLLNILQSTNFNGIEMVWIQNWTKQILLFLAKIHQIGIFHSDIKPENIMFRAQKTDKPILIDFSSSCTKDIQPFTYIQSRFYRAPQVLIGLKPYSDKLDIWSLGCSLVQIYLGLPLFPGGCSYDQLSKICSIISYDNFDIIELQKSQFGLKYFKEIFDQKLNKKIKLYNPQEYFQMNHEPIKQNDNYYHLSCINDILKHRNFSSKNIQTHQLFLDLIKKMLSFDPKQRISAEEAFLHPFIGGTYQELDQLRLIQELQNKIE